MAERDVERLRGLLARYSAGDLGAITDLIAPGFFTHIPVADEPTATEIYAGLAAKLKTAAPDLAIDIPDLVQGDDGYLRGTAVIDGTLTGTLWGVPPSGKRLTFRIPVTIRRVDDRFAVNADIDPPGAIAILREIELINPPDQMHLPPRHPVVLNDFILKLAFTGQVADKACSHLADVRVTQRSTDACDDCAPGQVWPALRMCLTCGHAGCCDTSTNKHARGHWEATGHPLMRSLRLDEGWIWCYEDNAFFQRRTLDRIEARLAGAG